MYIIFNRNIISEYYFPNIHKLGFQQVLVRVDTYFSPKPHFICNHYYLQYCPIFVSNVKSEVIFFFNIDESHTMMEATRISELCLQQAAARQVQVRSTKGSKLLLRRGLIWYFCKRNLLNLKH